MKLVLSGEREEDCWGLKDEPTEGVVLEAECLVHSERDWERAGHTHTFRDL